MNYIRQIRKAIIPVLVSAALAGLAALGVAEDMTVAEAVTTLVTAGLVWLVPNERV